MIHDKWLELLEHARLQQGCKDHSGRQFHSLNDIIIKDIGVNESCRPISIIRRLGWLYPSDEELKSIMLGTNNYFLYSYSSKIFEQIPAITSLLHKQPNTRKATMILANSKIHELDKTPSLISAHFRREKSSINLTLNIRSLDLVFGLPANLYHAKVLITHIAEQLGLNADKITLFVNNAHVFDEYEEIIIKIKNHIKKF